MRDLINKGRYWRVKDAIDSPWRDLPGTHSFVEIWRMRVEGFFVAAILSDEQESNEDVLQ